VVLPLAGWLVVGAAVAGVACGVTGALLGRRMLQTQQKGLGKATAVTVLRPVSGAQPGLEQALASSLEQDYAGAVQLICGLQDPADPARQVVERLKAHFPDRDIAVTTGRTQGANRKVRNLINMAAAAKYDLLVLADADIVVRRSWLAALASSLAEESVGAASCFYAGEGGSFWSRLTAMGINYQFLPNALFGMASGLAYPCMGSTIALRRQTLAEIGGFEAFRDSLADDYEIGRAVRGKGLRLVYPPLIVRHLCDEPSFAALWQHELRWARTIRTADPLGHFGSLITHALPLALIGAALLGFSPPALIFLATVLAARLFLKRRIDHIAGTRAGPAWLLPLRDVLSFAVFLASLFGGAVEWKGERLRIGKHGAIS
jgi:ceramide glucosyltransferase